MGSFAKSIWSRKASTLQSSLDHSKTPPSSPASSVPFAASSAPPPHTSSAAANQWGCLITNSIVELAQREPAIKRKLDGHLTRMERAFASAIDRARTAGEIPHETPLERAAFLVCVVEGMNVLAKMKPSRKKLESNVSAAFLSLGV